MSWFKSIHAGLALAIVMGVAVEGCSTEVAPYSDPRSAVSPEEVPETKRIRRLTADQFFASLYVATGQRWDDQNQFAATLGRPDFSEVTAEGREMSVGFAKLAGDAARQTCRRAVQEDRELSTPESRSILRAVSIDPLDPFDPGASENLRYLLLRFLGVYITDDADRRLQPWLGILQEGLDPIDDARFERAQDRWTAVCAGLALHPDFLTY